MTPEQEIRCFLATGEYDAVLADWPGHRVIERIHAGDAALRAALIAAIRQRTKNLAFPSIPDAFDADRFVLDKVRPMVCGLFPAKEQQVMLDLFEKSLVFVSGDNVEDLILAEVVASAVEARNGWKRILAHCRSASR